MPRWRMRLKLLTKNTYLMKFKSIICGLFAFAAVVACKQDEPVVEPALEVTPATASVKAEGGEVALKVTSNVNWTAVSDSDWATVDTPSGKGSENAAEVKVSVDENKTEAARTAVVTVATETLKKTVKITQAAPQGEEPTPEPPVEETKTYILVGDAVGGWDVDKNGVILTLTDGYYVAKSVAVIAQKGMHFTMNNKWEGNIKGKVGLMAPNTIGEVGNNDISLTENGNFDVYLTEALDKFYFMSEGKLPSEATEHQEIAVQWGVCGDIAGNSWGAAADPVMTEEGEWFVAKGIEFNTVNFKVRGNNSWADDVKWGRAEKSYACALNAAIPVSTCTEYKAANPDAADNENIYIETSGTYDIYFSPEKKEIWVMTPGYKPGDNTPEPEPVEVTYTVTGTIVDNYWNNAAEVGLMTLEGDYYVAKGLSMELDSVMKPDGDNPADYVKFKICKTGTWDAYGVTSESAEVKYVPNAEIPVVSGGADIFVDGAGTYDVYFDLTNGKVWVMTAGLKPGETPAVPEPAKVTIAEFLAAAEGDTYYQLTGKITNIKNSNYGNFTIEDETGSVYVYGLTATKVDANDMSFASLGLKAGDTVTLCGTRSSYNNEAQVGGPAYYVSHVVGEEIVTPIEEVTLAQFLEKSVSTDVLYKITGTITSIASDVYGNVYLKDEAGTEVYVYGIKEHATAGNQTFANLGLKVGDTVTVVGYRSEYNGSAQMKDAYYVSHVAGEEPEEPELPELTHPQTSNVAWTLGTKAYDHTATINGTADVPVLKLGSGSAVGDATIVLTAGTKRVGFYVASWNGKQGMLELVWNDQTMLQLTPVTNSGFAGSEGVYTVEITDESQYYVEINTSSFGMEALPQDFTYTIRTAKTDADGNSYDPRAIIWGINTYTE